MSLQSQHSHYQTLEEQENLSQKLREIDESRKIFELIKSGYISWTQLLCKSCLNKKIFQKRDFSILYLKTLKLQKQKCFGHGMTCGNFIDLAQINFIKKKRITVSLISELRDLFLAKVNLVQARYLILKNHINISRVKFLKIFAVMRRIIHKFIQTQFLPSVRLEGQIEIDECYVNKPKQSGSNTHSHPKNQKYVFGMVQRTENTNGRKVCIFFPLEERKSEIIMSLIRNYVNDFATIYSDSFSVYIDTRTKKSHIKEKLFDKRLNHLVINHSKSLGFKDNIYNINTNTIECLWGHLRRQLRQQKSKDLEGQASLFMFHMNFSFQERVEILTSLLYQNFEELVKAIERDPLKESSQKQTPQDFKSMSTEDQQISELKKNNQMISDDENYNIIVNQKSYLSNSENRQHLEKKQFLILRRKLPKIL